MTETSGSENLKQRLALLQARLSLLQTVRAQFDRDIDAANGCPPQVTDSGSLDLFREDAWNKKEMIALRAQAYLPILCDWGKELQKEVKRLESELRSVERMENWKPKTRTAREKRPVKNLRPF